MGRGAALTRRPTGHPLPSCPPTSSSSFSASAAGAVFGILALGPGAQVPQRRGRRLRPCARWRCSSPTSTCRCAPTARSSFPWPILPHSFHLVALDDRHRARRWRISLVYAGLLGLGAVRARLPAAAPRDPARARLRVGRHDALLPVGRGPQLRHVLAVDRRTSCRPARSTSRGVTFPVDRLWFAGHRPRCSPRCSPPSTTSRASAWPPARPPRTRRARRSWGCPPTRSRSRNWIIATVLAGLAGILIAPIVDGRPGVLHAVHRPGARRRAARALHLVRRRRDRRPAARHGAVGDHQAAHRLDLAAAAAACPTRCRSS